MNVRLIENCDFDEDGEFLGSDSHFSNDLACNDADDFPDETVLDEIEDEGHQFEDDEEFLDEEYFQPSLPRDGQRRAFQLFWCGTEEAAERDFPKPDSYGFRENMSENRTGAVRRVRRDGPVPRNFFLERELIARTSSESDVKYPPKRPPPILDFAFVFTSFVAALVIAYYTVV